jgi:hypothetical protein
MDFQQQRDRFQNDPLFHSVVDMIYSFLMRGEITVGELRDAVTFAGVLFEQQNSRPIFYFKEVNHEK